MLDKRIIGDVWLFNCGVTPIEPEWNDPTEMPFKNPQDYVVTMPDDWVFDEKELTCLWIWEGDVLSFATLFFRGAIFARLAPGSKPGWAMLARKMGHLRKSCENNGDQHLAFMMLCFPSTYTCSHVIRRTLTGTTFFRSHVPRACS